VDSEDIRAIDRKIAGAPSLLSGVRKNASWEFKCPMIQEISFSIERAIQKRIVPGWGGGQEDAQGIFRVVIDLNMLSSSPQEGSYL